MKSRTQSLLKDSIILSIGDVGSKLLIFALIPFFTYYLSSAEFGILDLVQVTITLCIPLLTLSIYESMLRFILDGENIKVVLSTTFIVLLLGMLLSGLILIFASIYISFNYRYLLIYSMFLLNSLHITLLYYCRSIKNIKLYAYNSLVYSFTLVTGTFVFISIFHFGLDGFFLANIVAYITSIFYFFNKLPLIGLISNKSFDYNTAKRMVSYSLPLMPNSLMWWLINASSRYLILIFLGTSANGVFAVSSRISGVITVFNSVFFKAWQLSAIEFKDSADTQQYNRVVFKNFVSFIFIVVGVCVIILKPMFSFLGSEYYTSWKYTPFLLIAVLFSSVSSFLGTNYLVNMETKKVFVTSLISAFITLSFNLFLIPFIGLYGVGLASILGFLVMTVLRWRDNEVYSQDMNLVKHFIFNLILLSLNCIILFVNINSILLIIIQIMIFITLVAINFELCALFITLIKGYVKKIKRSW